MWKGIVKNQAKYKQAVKYFFENKQNFKWTYFYLVLLALLFLVHAL